jgi:hypothetical protein
MYIHIYIDMYTCPSPRTPPCTCPRTSPCLHAQPGTCSHAHRLVSTKNSPHMPTRMASSVYTLLCICPRGSPSLYAQPGTCARTCAHTHRLVSTKKPPHMPTHMASSSCAPLCICPRASLSPHSHLCAYAHALLLVCTHFPAHELNRIALFFLSSWSLVSSCSLIFHVICNVLKYVIKYIMCESIKK